MYAVLENGLVKTFNNTSRASCGFNLKTLANVLLARRVDKDGYIMSRDGVIKFMKSWLDYMERIDDQSCFESTLDTVCDNITFSGEFVINMETKKQLSLKEMSLVNTYMKRLIKGIWEEYKESEK